MCPGGVAFLGEGRGGGALACARARVASARVRGREARARARAMPRAARARAAGRVAREASAGLGAPLPGPPLAPPPRNCETGAGFARTRALGRRRIASRSRPRSPLAPRSSRGRRSGGASSCARRPSRPRRSHPRLARLLRGPRARPGFLPRSALVRVGFPNSRGSDRARERVARAVARAELEAAACRRALRGVPFPRVQTSPGGSRPSQCRAGGGGRGAWARGTLGVGKVHPGNVAIRSVPGRHRRAIRESQIVAAAQSRIFPGAFSPNARNYLRPTQHRRPGRRFSFQPPSRVPV